MVQHEIEKRKYPRLDTSQADWKIRVYGVKGRPLEGQILNLSLGGVAFIGHRKKIAKTVKRFTTKVEIQLPNGTKVNAKLTEVWFQFIIPYFSLFKFRFQFHCFYKISLNIIVIKKLIQ